MATPEELKKFDLNNDGQITFQDLIGIAKDIYKPTFWQQKELSQYARGEIGNPFLEFIPMAAAGLFEFGGRMLTGKEEYTKYNEEILTELGTKLGLENTEIQYVIAYGKEFNKPNSGLNQYDTNVVPIINNLTNVNDGKSYASQLESLNYITKAYSNNSSKEKNFEGFLGFIGKETSIATNKEMDSLTPLLKQLGYKDPFVFGDALDRDKEIQKAKVDFILKNQTKINSTIINNMQGEATKAGIDTRNINWSSPTVVADLTNLVNNNYLDKNSGLYKVPKITINLNEKEMLINDNVIATDINLQNRQGSTSIGGVNQMSAPSTTNAQGQQQSNPLSAPVVDGNPAGFSGTGDGNPYLGIYNSDGNVQIFDDVTGTPKTVKAIYTRESPQKVLLEMSAAELKEIKMFLYASGHYGSNDPVNFNSNITQTDIKAMEIAMGNANLNGITVQEYLKPRYDYYLEFGRPYGDDAVDLDGDGKADESNASALSQFLLRNGLKPDGNYIKSFTDQIVAGRLTLNDAMKQIREKTISGMFPVWSEDIKNGRDIIDIANPYITSIATTFGVDSSTISVNDPRVQKALSYRDSEGKPANMSLFDFKELVLRNDPAWEDTAEAQAAYEQFGNALSNRWNIR
jgi:hypothetical protein